MVTERTTEFCGNSNITSGNLERGGGIRVNSSNPIIQRNIIIYNAVLGGSGGGIFSYGSGYVVGGSLISNNIIAYNTSRSYGGGIYLQGRNALIENNKIFDNVAEKGGGGIFCNGFLNIIKNNLIIENFCLSEEWDFNKDHAGGGICFSYVDSSTIINNTIFLLPQNSVVRSVTTLY